MVTVARTDEYDRLVEMFLRHGLEFSSEEPLPTDPVQGWKAEDENGRLISGCILARRGGEYIIAGIATEPEYRQARIGSELLQLALSEARARGGDRIYLVARAPGFFRKHGFTGIPADEVPGLFDCCNCPQLGVTCHPEVMMLALA